MSYTKGPWEACCLDRTPHYVFANNGDVAVCKPLAGEDVDLNQTRANARLIAAAPELLEALQDCYRALIAQGCHLDKQMPLEERLDAAKKAQKAIAKALKK